MLQVVNCNYEMMQWNPGKQKLTDRLFRGFWIRESAHFHPVGQSPGEMCSRTKSQRGWRQEENYQVRKKHSKQKVRRERQRGGAKERGTCSTYEQIMRQWAPRHKHVKGFLPLLHKRKTPKQRGTKQLQMTQSPCSRFMSLF